MAYCNNASRRQELLGQQDFLQTDVDKENNGKLMHHSSCFADILGLKFSNAIKQTLEIAEQQNEE